MRISSKTSIMVITGYLVLLSVLNFCAALSPVGYSDLFGGIGGTTVTSQIELEEVEDVGEATSTVPTVNSFINTLGVIGIVLSILLALVAVSFMQRKPWAYTGVVIVLAMYVVLSVLAVIGRAGFDTLSPFQIVFIVVSGIIVLYMLLNNDLKRQYIEA